MALATLAAEYAPVPVTTAPFVSLTEKVAETRKRRRLRRTWLMKRAAASIAAMGVLYAFITAVVFRLPADEALADAAARVAQSVLLLYSSSNQPLEIDHAVPLLNDTFDSGHLRYFAEVTLRLREPLYGPAVTNGTLNYRRLQESLQALRIEEQTAGLFSQNDGPAPPDLPRLIERMHRAGERLVVRVPFIAKKFGWKWRLESPQLEKRTVAGHFDGVPLGRFNDAPYLIFGLSETMSDIGARAKAARDYIIFIRQALQRYAAGEPLPLRPEPPPPSVPAASLNLERLQQINSDKPAVAPTKPR